MTRQTFEEWFKACLKDSDNPIPSPYEIWQAAEASITAKLDSEEFLKFMVQRTIFNSEAKSFIKAIKKELGL